MLLLDVLVIKCGVALAYLSTDPMDILLGKDSTDLFKGSAASRDIAYLLDLKGLWAIVKTNALLISVIAVAIILVSTYFVSKAEIFQEKKKDLMHKLGIVFLIGSLITVFNVVKAAMDAVFIG